MEAALALIRFMHFASALFLFGAGALRVAVPDVPPAADARLRKLLVAAVFLALTTAVLWFLFTVAQMAGAPAAMGDPQTLRLVLFHTGFGTLWSGRLILAVVLATLALFVRRFRISFIIVSALFAASLALTGHAAGGAGWPGSVHGIADAIHLLCAGIWLGGLCELLIVLRAAPSLAGIALRRFSALAIPAVALVVISGAANALAIVPDWAAFAGTRYGVLLIVKVALAAAMIALALLNRLIFVPQLERNSAAARNLRRSIAAEIVLGAIVLAIVGVLGLSAPQ